VRILAILLTSTLTALAAPGAAASAIASGCGTPVAAGTSTLSVRMGGRSRVVLVHVPSGYSPTRPTPLVLDLHGSASTARAQEVFTGMDATSDTDDFLVAYPQAALTDGTGFDWNVPGQPRLGGEPVPHGAANDVAFITGLVKLLRTRYCVDAGHVDATGFSGGARLASQLGCDAPQTFAAIAPVSGLRFPSPCPASRAVPVVAFHGTADRIDPYGGHGHAYWTYSVPDAASRWAAHDGCAAAPTTSTPANGATLASYSPCRSGSAVQLYTLTGEGHEWPGGPPLPKRITRVLGPQSNAIDANATMWSFFVAHRLAGSSP
jgi:polyhydroxybutyrate depolymerase